MIRRGRGPVKQILEPQRSHWRPRDECDSRYNTKRINAYPINIQPRRRLFPPKTVPPDRSSHTPAATSRTENPHCHIPTKATVRCHKRPDSLKVPSTPRPHPLLLPTTRQFISGTHEIIAPSPPKATSAKSRTQDNCPPWQRDQSAFGIRPKLSKYAPRSCVAPQERGTPLPGGSPSFKARPAGCPWSPAGNPARDSTQGAAGSSAQSSCQRCRSANPPRKCQCRSPDLAPM